MKRILPVIFIILFGSCFDQNDCVITSTNLVKIDLATLGGVAMTTTFRIVQQDSTGPGHSGNTRYPIFEKIPVGSLQLPLDPTRSRTYYSFMTSDSVRYTLSLKYTSFTRVISDDCGAFLYFQDLAVVRSNTAMDFDSTRVITPQLFKSVTTNIKLFF